MPYESKEGSGALFANDKGSNPSRPDWRGDLMVGGVLYEIAGWVKDGRSGEFISLSAKPKEERTEAPRQPQRSAAPSARPEVEREDTYRSAQPGKAPPSARPTGRMNDRRPREDDEADLDSDIPF